MGKLFIGVIKIYIIVLLFVVIGAFVFEYNTVTVDSYELMENCNQACLSACEYYSLETYRGNTHSIGNAYDLLDKDGHKAVSGRFYLGTEQETYNSIFCGYNTPDNLALRKFCDQLEAEIPTINEDKNFQIMQEVAYGSSQDANFLKNLCITPTNLGFCFLAPNQLTKIYKWLLVNKLTANSIVDENSGVGVSKKNYKKRSLINVFGSENDPKNFVKWRGFKIYYNTIKITDVKYEVFDLGGDSVEKDNFFNVTGIDADNYTSNSGINLGNKYDMRRYPIVANVTYEMDVAYDGTLPIKLLFDFATGTTVKENRKLMYDNVEMNFQVNENKRSMFRDGITKGNEEFGRTKLTNSSELYEGNQGGMGMFVYQGLNAPVRFTISF